MPIQRLQTNARMSQAVIANGFVFLAGQVAGDTTADVAGQTAQIVAKIDALLKEAGSDKTRIVQATIWLADHKTFAEMNTVWDAWVPEATPLRVPASNRHWPSRPTRSRSASSQPSDGAPAMHTVVLGAGVAGVATAWYLAAQGRQVTVIDRQPLPAAETSYANAGMVATGALLHVGVATGAGHSLALAARRQPGAAPEAQPRSAHVDVVVKFMQNCTAERSRLNTSRKLVLCRYSQSLLQQLTTAQDLAYERISRGALYLYRDEASFARGKANMQILADGGMRLELLDGDGVVAQEPALADARPHIAGAIYCPSDESGDARMFTRALTERCRAAGVTFVMDANIQRIEADASRIRAVHTNQGAIAADDYVLAMGSYSPIAARPLGYRLPIYPVKGYSVTFPTDTRHRPFAGRRRREQPRGLGPFRRPPRASPPRRNSAATTRGMHRRTSARCCAWPGSCSPMARTTTSPTSGPACVR